MVRFLLVFLSLLLPLRASALAVGPVNTLQICGQTLSTVNLIHLYCSVNGAGNRCNFRHLTNQTTGAAISSGYTPSGSNKFRVQVIQVGTRVGNSNAFAEPAYSDNDLGFASSGSWTNPVFAGGQSAGTTSIRLFTTNADPGNNSTQPNYNCIPAMNFLMPNGKYLGVKGDGTAVFWADVYGYEE